MAEHFRGADGRGVQPVEPVALAKVLTTFAKTNPNLVFKGAVIEGRAVAASEIKTIAELPSREELVAKLLFLIQSPLRRLVTVLERAGPQPGGRASGQIAEQKSKTGPADAAPAN